MTDYVEIEKGEVMSKLLSGKSIIYGDVPSLKMGVLNSKPFSEVEKMINYGNAVFFMKR